MTAAATVGPQWGQAYTYDGFGNLTQSHVTQGSGVEWSNASNPANNQMAGMTYDANGNNATPGAPCQTCGTSYDMENRLVYQYLDRNLPTWVYDPSGKRVAQTNGSNWTLYFYDVFGNRIETVNGDGNYPASGTGVTTNVYFGSKLIQSNGVAVATDRQGNVRYAANGTRFSYLPYGEEQTTATPDGQIKFGTYLRDSSDQSQDYANQRYYNPWFGRFNSPDPSRGGNAADPASWNKYAYTRGDPINRKDPYGTCDVYADDENGDASNPCQGEEGGGPGNNPDYSEVDYGPRTGGPYYGSPQRVYTGRTDPASNDPANAISPLIVQAMTLVGVNSALAALNNNPDCAGLFENESFTPNPATVLADIWNGTAYGSFAYAYIPDDVNAAGAITAWTNARTSGNGYLGIGPGGLPQFTSATITMNTNAGTPNNVSGTAQDWAVTVLHELGHVYQQLFGPGSTQIRYDGDGSPAGTSAANTSLVSRNCFK